MIRIGGTEYNLNHKAFEIYFAGCKEPHCPGCHNPELWDFRNGTPLTNKYCDEIIQKIKENDLIEKVWLLGGEPLDQDRIEMLWLIAVLKATGKEIWLFTGRELHLVPWFCLYGCDYIKCGRYEKDYKDSRTEYGVELASANQRIFKKGKDFSVMDGGTNHGD